MELQEVGRYEVEPFALERILELHLTKKVNEHARLSIRGVQGLLMMTGMKRQLLLKRKGRLCSAALLLALA